MNRLLLSIYFLPADEREPWADFYAPDVAGIIPDGADPAEFAAEMHRALGHGDDLGSIRYYVLDLAEVRENAEEAVKNPKEATGGLADTSGCTLIEDEAIKRALKGTATPKATANVWRLRGEWEYDLPIIPDVLAVHLSCPPTDPWSWSLRKMTTLDIVQSLFEGPIDKSLGRERAQEQAIANARIWIDSLASAAGAL